MFDRCVVINLDRRTERWQFFSSQVPADWPFPKPERWTAYPEGPPDHLPPPYWHQCLGAWGCFQSHVAVLRSLVESDAASYLVLEDDAIFATDFSRQALRFLENVPSDWSQLYFGGQHWQQQSGLPMAVNALVLQAWNVNRTHAYAIRREFAEEALDYFTNHPHSRHVDYLFGDLHQGVWRRKRHHHRRLTRIYTPTRWLIGQAEGPSDIAGQVRGRDSLTRLESWWNTFHYLDEFGQRQQQQ